MTMILLRKTSSDRILLLVLLFVGAFLIARPLMKCPKTTRQKKAHWGGGGGGGTRDPRMDWTVCGERMNGTRELRNQTPDSLARVIHGITCLAPIQPPQLRPITIPL
jgi:hypothetical protein